MFERLSYGKELDLILGSRIEGLGGRQHKVLGFNMRKNGSVTSSGHTSQALGFLPQEAFMLTMDSH